MEKRKPWQYFTIVVVLLLTLYNILPTVFYYSKPLKQPVGEELAIQVAEEMTERVNTLEGDAIDWVYSFAKHLSLKPVSVTLNPESPSRIEATFANAQDARLFRAILPRAGALISFVPAQLALSPTSGSDEKTVVIERNIATHFDRADIHRYFRFSPLTENNAPAPLYREVIADRAAEIADATGGVSRTARQAQVLVEFESDRVDPAGIDLAAELTSLASTFGEESPLFQRYLKSFMQGLTGSGPQSIITRLDGIRSNLAKELQVLEAQKKKAEETSSFLEPAQQQRLEQLTAQAESLSQAVLILRRHSNTVGQSLTPIDRDIVVRTLMATQGGADRIEIGDRNLYVEALLVDWTDGSVSFLLHPDIEALREPAQETEVSAFLRDKTGTLLANEMARIARRTGEEVIPGVDAFAVQLHKLTNPQSMLLLDLSELAADRTQQLQVSLAKGWQPSHNELQRSAYPLLSYGEHINRSSQEQKLGLVVYAPSMFDQEPPEGFRSSSLYVIARGMGSILEKFQQFADSEEAQELIADVQSLQSILAQSGFIVYPGDRFGIDNRFKQDLIFELDDFYSNLLTATREDFSVHGSKRYAVLDFTDVEQRILATNKIEDAIHENLLQWKEDYAIAQVELNPLSVYNVPPPTKNVYWENLKLTLRKYVRGDDRKILRWGLDLSGGKSVRIGLRDQNNRVVTDPEDVNQAVNELYTRINKMGVAERNIRVENSNIILEFPGSQGLSATELVKASAMYFHIVNEAFNPETPDVGDAVNKFLQEVWNEAVVTNRKEIDSINEIAWRQMGGDLDSGSSGRPRSEIAQQLYDAGLRLAGPGTEKSNRFDDSLSMVARIRGDDYSEWRGQTHPLMIVFNNFALEGSSLENVQVGYDQNDGNILVFGVRRSYDKRSGSPREDFSRWTTEFAQDRIAGTAKEKASRGGGWRMAVILNDEVVTWPSLKAALKDGGTISGRFTQREIASLAADLKAGSLSFTPRVLSEYNISPELGQEERTAGIRAALFGLSLVIAFMIYTYRFAGFVATCAVVLNLFIMWAVLQNLDAALSLPGIAALVLTIGMSVDANVLVFERTREELAVTGKIASALQAGYRKAFSAIVDSNLTTIIAALILIQFDSGPIKGFATTLIIGIVSSMFTSLFATRFYFSGWAQTAKDKTLTMVRLIGDTNFDFLRWARFAIIASLIFIVAGMGLLYEQRATMFGMDFTGGYSISMDLEETEGRNYRSEAIQALLSAGLEQSEFLVQELSRPSQLRVQLGISLEEEERPFYGMPKELEDQQFTHEYQRNPRLVWIVNALAAKDLRVEEWQLDRLDNNWSEMSGQLSDAMRNNAIIALTCALAAILIYITFRFEFKYGIGAVIALAHDVLVTLAAMAALHALGWPVQIDLQVVGAIMTIIGYSLNDTIIVFDRVREDVRVLKKLTFPEIVNHALNVTLSRTVMTSGTTLMVLVALVLFGGASIFTFSLVMTIGVLFGTLSSLFISAPIMLYFHNREVEKQEKALALKHA